MFDRLEDLLIRFEEIMSELNEPFVVNDQTRFQKLMKEQSDLQPIVDAYKEYKESKQTVEDSLSMLEEESDEEMREMLKEELNDATAECGSACCSGRFWSAGTNRRGSGFRAAHAEYRAAARSRCRTYSAYLPKRHPGRAPAASADSHRP